MKLLTLAFVLVASIGAAQAPVAPALDALDKQAIDLATSLGQSAQTACAALESVKAYDKARSLVNAQVKAKHPGYVYNWQTKRLEPQAAK